MIWLPRRKSNVKLYDRLVCKIVADNDLHFVMEWKKTRLE